MKIIDFQILAGKTTEEITALVKDAIKEGWEPMDNGFQVEYLDQTAANYVIAMVKPAAVRNASKKSATKVKKTSPAKKKTKTKK